MNQVELAQNLQDWLKYKEPFLITSEPGCGKTAIVQQGADIAYGPVSEVEVDDYTEPWRPYYHVEHAILLDPTDVSGVQYVNITKGGELARAKPEWFQWMLAKEGLSFWDELGQGSQMTQSAVMRLFHERQVAMHRLRPGWTLGAATNEAHHRAGAQQLNRALLGRFTVRVDLTVDPEQFREYAIGAGFDFRTTSYLAWQPQDTQAFDADKKSSPTCRGWDQVSRVLRFTHQPLEIFAGILGEGVGTKFAAFCRLQEKVTPPAEIVKNPDTVPIPKENDMRFATIGALVQHLKNFDAKKLGQAIIYGKRQTGEFSMLLARDLLREHKDKLLALPAMQNWITENKHILL